MKYGPARHHRRSIRLKGYDYAQAGAYFVTIVTQDRACLFGEVVDGEMRLNDGGRIADQCWLDIPSHFPQVELDTFVVMPNHVHGIIVIDDSVGAKHVGAKHVGAKHVGAKHVGAKHVGAKDFSPLPDGATITRVPLRSPSKTIGSMVRGFKIGVTKWFRENTDIPTVWQRNYYEHIIRNEDALNRIRQYIADNPLGWAHDQENPLAVEPEPGDAWRADSREPL